MSFLESQRDVHVSLTHSCVTIILNFYFAFSSFWHSWKYLMAWNCFFTLFQFIISREPLTLRLNYCKSCLVWSVRCHLGKFKPPFIFICLCSPVWRVLYTFTLYLSYLWVILSRRISLVPRHLSTAFPFLFSTSLPSYPTCLSPGGLPFVIDPCPGCLGIDWLSPCHWSSLSILTRFGHPLRCGWRVGESGRYTRCSTAPGDKIKMNERESKTKRDGQENDGGRQCVKQLVSNLIRLLHFSRAFLVFDIWSFTVYELKYNVTLPLDSPDICSYQIQFFSFNNLCVCLFFYLIKHRDRKVEKESSGLHFSELQVLRISRKTYAFLYFPFKHWFL